MRYLTLLVGLLSLSLALASQTQSSTNPSQTPSNNQNEHTGANAGTPGTHGSQTPSNQNEPTGGNAGTPGIYGDVQDKIQKAIQEDSSLSGANVNVTVSGSKVELNGTVASKDQKKTAQQIAESNAGGLKVVDHLKVEKGANSNSPNPH